MGNYSYYASMANNLNNPNATLDEIKGWFNANPINRPDWKPTQLDVTKPTLKSNDQILDELGLDKSKYNLSTMQKALDEQSYKAYNGLNDSLYAAKHKVNVSAAENYRSFSDTINAKYSQGVDLGISKAMDQANLLSTMLGTSQQNQHTVQNIDAQLAGSQARLKDSLVGNEQAVHDTYDSLQEYLSKTAEQLYKADIKRQEAEEKFNQTGAEYYKGLTNYETVYAEAVNDIASAIYNNNQYQKSLIGKAATIAEAADKMSQRYIERAKENAAATVASAGLYGYSVYTSKLSGVEDVLSSFFSNTENLKNASYYQNIINTLNKVMS